MSKPVAIITGAGKGIGRATAIELASRGYELALAARTKSDLDETIKQAGCGIAIPADVSRLEDVERVVAQTIERFGRIDALVNNAGYAPVRSIDQHRRIESAALTGPVDRADDVAVMFLREFRHRRDRRP